jgi:Zn-finger nucleic acid-binding protein
VSICPVCTGQPLVFVEVMAGIEVELCRGCKGMLVDAAALEQLAGVADRQLQVRSSETPTVSLEAMYRAVEVFAGTLRPCLRCNTDNWRSLGLPGAATTGVFWCDTCSMVWLLAGELDRLRERVTAERWRRRVGAKLALASDATGRELVPNDGAGERAAPGSAPRQTSSEPADRVSFEHGLGNVLGVPLALGLGLLFCSTPVGHFLGALAGMPFHELGHALASWLSSRFAVPLPFFTVWHERQSVLFGLSVAATLVWLGWRSRHEQRRFGLVLSLGLLSIQIGLSWFVPARLTSMLQILSGALGEIVIAALVLVAFHFPLPDRLRWDFWRWPALLPASLCLARSLLLWSRAVDDVRQIPWGSAIGSEADGDMNRLVASFGWKPAELATFYLTAGITSLAALALTQVWMWRRQHRAHRLLRRQTEPASERPSPDAH